MPSPFAPQTILQNFVCKYKFSWETIYSIQILKELYGDKKVMKYF